MTEHVNVPFIYACLPFANGLYQVLKVIASEEGFLRKMRSHFRDS